MLILMAAANLVEAQPIRLLILMPDHYGANYFLDRDDFENFGWTVTTAGVTSTVTPCPDYAGPLGCPVIAVDVLVSEIQNIADYDILVVTSGSGGNNSCSNLINSPQALQLVRDAADSGMVVGAMCSGVRVLAAAGVINGIHVTSNLNDSAYCVSHGAIHVGICAPPVIDGNIVTTSIGDYYHHQNTEAVMRAFCENGKKKSTEKNATRLISDSMILDMQTLASDTIVITTYGDTLAEGGRSLCKTMDGGYLISGFTYSSGEGYSDALLMKVDAGGNQQWIRTIGGSLPDYANDAIETSDGNYLACGFTFSSGAGSADLLVFKTGPTGNVIWSRTYGGTGYDIGKSVCETFDGKYMVCGYTESFGNGIDDIYLIKLDTAGNILWQNTYGSAESDMGNHVIETTDSAYVIAGNAGNRIPFPGYGWWGDRNACLLKVDADGNLIYEKKYNQSNYQQWGNAVVETADHHFMIAGNNDLTSSELLNAYLIKASPDGSKEWARSYGESTYYDYGNAISASSDSSYLICGTTKSVSNGNDVYFLKVDKNGNKLSKKIIGEEGFDWGSALCSAEGKEILVGTTNSYGSGGYDIMLIELTDLSSPVRDLSGRKEQSSAILNCSPNPFSNSVSFRLFISGNGLATLSIADLCGRGIRTYPEIPPGDRILTWDGRDNSGIPVKQGIYFLVLQSKTGIQTQKIMLIR